MDQGINGSRKLGADILLLTVTLCWGITFIYVKAAIESVGVFVFLSQRFGLAFGIIFAICFIRRGAVKRQTLIHGAVLGLFLFGGFAFQTIALLFTTASNAAFLTGLNVVLVPVIGAVIFSQVIKGTMKLGVLLAAVGLFCLCTGGTWRFNGGDALAVMCAVCVALHVIYTGKYAHTDDIYWLTAFQLGVVAFMSYMIAWFVGDGGAVFVWYPGILPALVICVLFATVFAFLAQTAMQRYTSPTHTALIFCMEPVFAAIFAYVMISERWTVWGYTGAGLILAGMIVSELSPRMLWPRAKRDTAGSGAAVQSSARESKVHPGRERSDVMSSV
jgi:drug/metabolite transporter (DMT)-like permease